MNYLGDISLKKLITLIKTEIKTNSGGSADRVTYDNTTSGLAGSNVQEAIDELASNVGESFDAVIGTTWTGDAAPYTQEIAVAGILEDDDPITDLVVSDDYTTSQLQLEEFAKIYKIKTGDDKITVYANEKTTVSLPIQMVVSRDKVMDTEVIDGAMLIDGSVTAEKLDPNIDLGGIEMVKLWENASPASQFAAQTISLNLSGYDYIKIAFGYSDSNNAIASVIEIENTANSKGRGVVFDTWQGGHICAIRDVTLKSNGVTFAGCNANQTDNTNNNPLNNYMCIPITIYGIKGVK